MFDKKNWSRSIRQSAQVKGNSLQVSMQEKLANYSGSYEKPQRRILNTLENHNGSQNLDIESDMEAYAARRVSLTTQTTRIQSILPRAIIKTNSSVHIEKMNQESKGSPKKSTSIKLKVGSRSFKSDGKNFAET